MKGNYRMRKFEYVNRVLSTGYSMKEPEFDLPKRATKNSIAYDFYSPEDFVVEPHSKYMLWTGIKAQFQDDEALILNVRSSMGKKNIMLSTTNADCILLFGYHRFDVFPVDTWIKKVYKDIFKKENSSTNIHKDFMKMYGDIAGLAQQYLFYTKREDL